MKRQGKLKKKETFHKNVPTYKGLKWWTNELAPPTQPMHFPNLSENIKTTTSRQNIWISYTLTPKSLILNARVQNKCFFQQCVLNDP